MKKLLVSMMVVLAAVFALQSCGEGTPDVELSAEMKGFVELIKGSHEDVSKALETYASNDEIKDDDMGMYDLSDPKVTKKEGDCFSVEFSAGITTRMYDICWKDGKISEIKDNGMK